MIKLPDVVMDFETYKAKVQAFATCFKWLTPVCDIATGVKKKGIKRETIADVNNDIASCIRSMMSVETRFTTPFFPLPTDCLPSIRNVNLAADLESITKQAEKVKQDIISLGKALQMLSLARHDLPRTIILTDYIRDSAGKIVFPFDYWEDCIEVYLKSRGFNESNEKIAGEYNFKSSRSGTQRAKLKLVSDMLTEVNKLQEAVRQNKFPPRVLTGTKQPTFNHE